MDRSPDEQCPRFDESKTRVHRLRGSSYRIAVLFLLMLATAGGFGCRSRSEEIPATPDPATQRTIAQGTLVGFSTEDGAHAWRGVPFAKPPVGSLRWRAPRPPEPWSGSFEAVSHGASCVQFAGPGGGRKGEKSGEASGSEDCLYLNIYAPKFDASRVPAGDARIPVMVWIHGGGNTIGDATIYDGSILATQENVILVTLQYRLGVLGWFSHPSLRGEGSSAVDGSGNYGTLDLVQGLKWVKENIGVFGGDPNRVTVFGESAGGSDTFSMLLSPQAQGLFQRAIVESGSALTTPRSMAENFVDDTEPGDPASSNEILLKHLIADARAGDREQAKAALARMDGPAIARYLREMDIERLLEVYDGSGLGGMYPSPALIRDGAVLPLEPAIEAFELGKYNQVPTIMGTNRDENRLFLMFMSPHVAHLMGLPLWLKDVDRFQASAEYPSKMWKVRGVDAPASRMRAVQGESVYAYRFDWDEEPKVLFLDLSKALGAGHGIEIPFVFGWLSLGPGTRFVFADDKMESNRRLSRSMMSYWAEFAYSGNPGRGRKSEQPLWNSWSDATQSSDKFIIFDSEAGGGVRMSNEDTLTRVAVIAQVAADARLLEHKRDRCEIYQMLTQWGRAMSDADYAAVEEGGCADEFPLEEHPWKS